MTTYAGRKRPASATSSERSPLKSITNQIPSLEMPDRRLPKKAKLTQAVLDFGQRPPKPCLSCGMPYRSHDPEEVRLHRSYCRAGEGKKGLQVTRSFLGNSRQVGTCLWQRDSNKDHNRGRTRCRLEENDKMAVFEIARRDTDGVRRFAGRALSIAEEELGAVRTSQEELWSTCALQHAKRLMKSEGTQSEHIRATGSAQICTSEMHDRYKLYLAVVKSQCVGVCLAERIALAHKATAVAISPGDAYITLSEELYSATMGVSRIWVSEEFRRTLIASNLLETARGHFVHGVEVEAGRVALSQPTGLGAKFARKWFGLEDGWLVYREDDCRGGA